MSYGDVTSAYSNIAVIIRFTFVLKENVMHNRCHTDSINIEDLHGHTEPHV